ncbi:uncharacterized protein KD926_006010 [Aspergillus affinis]|uniref:uncharacterized protein n=1 Tax=Aspergillus affinis TaxID=1070780 RepID=UPI0022FF33DF|nr:uncharacterized protein KD926_006010 [Aspergillus affinis]KAI9046063.1 hypothetical protein KD926_006010 [Aspergillus affinis]
MLSRHSGNTPRLLEVSPKQDTRQLSPSPQCTNIDADDFHIRSLNDDSLAVTRELETLVEGHGKLVVVAQKGGVLHLYYICGLILNEGESGQSTLASLDEDEQEKKKTEGLYYFRNPAKRLYSDLDSFKAALWESRIIPQPAGVFWTRVTRTAYKYIPSTYLICQNDVHMPPPFQEAFSSFAEAEVERSSAGHAPMLSQPDMLVRRISTVATRAMREVSD